MNTYGGVRYSSSSRLGFVISFTPKQLYPREKSPMYPLDRRLGGP